MTEKTNILSYFIKDIKDPIKCAMYKQNNSENYITIWYKHEIIFLIDEKNIFNYINNIYKSRITNNTKGNYKILSWINFKHLYYKRDSNIRFNNTNYITFIWVIYTKYLIKTAFYYISNNVLLFRNKVKYYNRYKYISEISEINKRNNKYTNNIILIMNKYELHYYNKFFNFYFELLG